MSKLQFNLLPDVKLKYIQTQNTKKVVLGLSTIVTVAAFSIFLILLLTVNVVQKKQLSDADAQIKQKTSELQGIEGLDQALTVQNQLNTLSSLHKSKHMTSRLFGYLPQITPTNVTISKIDVDYETNTLKVTGSADSQHTVNTFIDTMKFTKYKVGDEETGHTAFTDVVEESFSIAGNKAVNFVVNATFDPKLFSNEMLDDEGLALTPKLEVPSLTTTRSFLESSGNPLFKEIIQVEKAPPPGAEQ